MTPARAIKLECKWCRGFEGIRKAATCDSDICKLNDKALSPLKRIKLHCLDCVETRQEVKNCTGKLLSEERLCYLHPYRFGHNPKRKGIGCKGGNPHIKNIRKPQSHDIVGASKNDSDCV
jgi:hypothetical protein